MKKLMILGFAVATVALLSNGMIAFAGGPNIDCQTLTPAGVIQEGNYIVGTSGPDTIDCSNVDKRLWIEGNGGPDVIIGGQANDYIRSGANNNAGTFTLLDGQSGKDWIEGGAGNHVIIGGKGPDFLRGGKDGANDVWGGTGKDEIDGGKGGSDFCFGATGAKETTKGCELDESDGPNKSIADVLAVYTLVGTTPSEDIDDE